MKNFSSIKRKTLSSIAVTASLALAASVAAIGTAHSAATVKVVITGTASCAKDATPTVVTITPKKGKAGSDETPGDEQSEQYTITLTGIPNNGTTATAKVTCLDDEGDVNTPKKKDVPIKKPANNSPLTLNIP
ncbi:hypothetical protein AB0E04_19370 [Streptomyces sp. NPDC048251]|uniref:hypothetical protein n=1 Tax=Streptomyces sp. NPDC048251 TaxID=3154501 RepID=UPI00341BC5B3